MPLQQSNLITRKQLNCLSGGSKSKSKSKSSTSSKYGNPLKLGTPFSYCGGRAFALSQGRIHHVCIKEKCNRPLPESSNEPFIIYRIAKNGRMDLPTDIETLANTVDNAIQGSLDTMIIPIFWEPINQLGKSPTISGTGVTYVGHWKAVEVKQLSNNFVYLGQKRCAQITFEFDRYDQCTSTIINQSYDKTCEEIDTMSFDDGADSSSSSNTYYKEEQQNVKDKMKDKEKVSSYAAGRYPKPKDEESESDDDDDDDDYCDDDSDNGNLKRRASRNKKRSINQVKEETSSGSRKVAARQSPPPSTRKRNSNSQYKREIKNENHRKNQHEDLQHLASSSSCSPYRFFQIDLLLQQQEHQQSQEATTTAAAATTASVVRPFIRVQHKPYISFGELRTAIDQQLDLKEPYRNSNFHFCIDGLDLSTRQEEWNVYNFVFNTTKFKVAEREGTAAEPIDIDGDDSDNDDDDVGKDEEGSASELGTMTSNPFRIAIKPPRRVI